MLVSEPAAVRYARMWSAGMTEGVLDAERRGDFELVLTEVVSNAVRHGGTGGEIKVAVAPAPGYLRVEVTDDGPGLVPRPGAIGSEENGGFGLFIVERLSRRWGVARENLQTRVWFEFEY
jgi:serine/threonine-protein kinase RsbW